ncbi:helix-turn-helix domain-containing protein [Mesorhizobium sp. 1B3]|uniref:helix-turn-helix domain-containing protein n=1 Tax=Mesorhizobium sp. 1B3 TaxID=3243599 RepID=UPI003D973CD8
MAVGAKLKCRDSAKQECRFCGRSASLPVLNDVGDCELGLVLMSERELQRIEVLSKVMEGRLRTVTAAHVLGLTPRQVQRLLKRFAFACCNHREQAVGRGAILDQGPAGRGAAGAEDQDQQ